MSEAPKIDNAPGLTWRPRKYGWEARWRARPDLVRRGYRPANIRLWISTVGEREPDDIACDFIADRCRILQDEMLIWGRGGIEKAGPYTGTLSSLVNCYQTDPDSTYNRSLRFVTRDNYDGLCRRLSLQHGTEMIADIKARHLLRWHEEWTGDGRTAMAHSLMGMLRTLVNFGATILEDSECERLSSVLHKMKFPQGKPRTAALSAEQANAIRKEARATGYPSIALAQAFQFECILRQKDVIGEWVPLDEPAPPTDIITGNRKWIRGLRWEEIDNTLTLHHVTSKKNKMIEPPLREAPMVMEELCNLAGVTNPAELTRAMLPSSGPIVLGDNTGHPWVNQNFRRQWRKIAIRCGIPANVLNMDSRAGAISEATDAGAPLEHVRHAATHSDISMTQRYSRNSNDKTAGVMRTRAAFRTKE